MSVRAEVLQTLWHGNDPFANWSTVASAHPTDPQGWNSDHPYLRQTVDELRPRIVVEVGVWKGGSVMTLAAQMQALKLDSVVVAIDTWLGSVEHWLDPELSKHLRMKNGFPQLYHTFVSNLFEKGLQNLVVPLPLDSVNAQQLFKARGLQCDLLHIDAGHDYQSVFADLSAWWAILKDGGILIGDDYYTDDVTWQPVRKAFDTFFANEPIARFENHSGKCLIQKPSRT